MKPAPLSRGRGAVAAVVLAAAVGWTLGACVPERPIAEEEAQAPVEAPVPVTIELERTVAEGLPPFIFSLKAAAPAATGDATTARVGAVEIRRAGEEEPFQSLDAGGARLALDALPELVQLVDVDFDGDLDLRLPVGLPAGPDVPYRSWRFDAVAGRYEPAPELDALGAAVFDAATATVRSSWRDGAARYGADVLVWEDDELVLARREVKEYDAPGVYRLTVSERRDGTMVEIETREVVDDEEGGGDGR